MADNALRQGGGRGERQTGYHGNRNAMKHGLRSFEQGRWPIGTSYIPRIIKRLGDGLRAEVVRQHGATTVLSEALIATALRHEARALLTERLYRQHRRQLKPREQVELLEAIGNACAARDRCLEKLQLSVRPQDDADLWAGLPRLVNRAGQDGDE